MPPAPDRCRSAKSLCADPGGSVSAPAKRHSGALAPANDTALPTHDSFPSGGNAGSAHMPPGYSWPSTSQPRAGFAARPPVTRRAACGEWSPGLLPPRRRSDHRASRHGITDDHLPRRARRRLTRSQRRRFDSSRAHAAVPFSTERRPPVSTERRPPADSGAHLTARRGHPQRRREGFPSRRLIRGDADVRAHPTHLTQHRRRLGARAAHGGRPDRDPAVHDRHPRGGPRGPAPRIAATRWPEKETVDDASQGVQLATMQALARYWMTEYDWRKCEAKLNSVPAVHHRDRRAGHPLRPRSLQARGRAAARRLPRMARLGHRADEDRRPAHRPDGAWRQRIGRLPRGDPQHAGLRVLGQADRNRAGMRPASGAPGSS